MSAQGERVVRASRIELVDSTGRVRVILAAELGTPDLSGIEIPGADGEASVLILAGRYPTTDGSTVSMAKIDLEADEHGDAGYSIARMMAADSSGEVLVGYDDRREICLHASPSGTSLVLGSLHELVRQEQDATVYDLEPLPGISLSESGGATQILVRDSQGAVLFKAP
jgi:hypothetical protein